VVVVVVVVVAIMAVVVVVVAVVVVAMMIMSVTVNVAAGEESASITLQILPTNETRLMQEFIISLVASEPTNAASFKSGFSLKRFLVPDVGNPGGIFSFGPDMNSTYTVRVMICDDLT